MFIKVICSTFMANHKRRHHYECTFVYLTIKLNVII